MTKNLPPLPEGLPVGLWAGSSVFYTADEMREYGKACWEAGYLEAPKTPENGVDASQSGGLLAAVWRPIDSAPKDGTEVLVLCDGVWRPAEFATAYARWMGMKGWLKHEPTHWMPIPELSK